jgi:16S rRNA (cytosine967-C5)-methyltransferase
VRQALRVALAGRLLLKTPMHATIATTLPLLDGGPRRLAHAVLSRLDREDARLPPLPHLPPAWARRWESAQPAGFVAAARQALAKAPPTDLSLRDAGQTVAWAARLAGESLAPGHVRLSGAPALATLPGYAEGAWWAQDLAARQPALRLGDVAGKQVLDLCAAPGGKTMQLAAAGAEVTAVDSNARRLERLKANLARTGLAARLVMADVMEFTAETPFDAVLLDAPCTATGTFRRHPEVLHRRAPQDAAAMAATQAEMLLRAATFLRPGGRLVYAVCSIEPEEGALLVASVLAQSRLQLVGEELLLPGLGPGDGFYIASLVQAR